MTPRERVIATFRERFGTAPAFVARAPGRVNLIGEHTDYNDGFVLPIAIDRAVCIALRPRADRRVLVRSLDFDAEAELDLDRLVHGGEHWTEYVKGVAWQLARGGVSPAGWEGVMAGDVPAGAGLSSSAAVELAVARAFAAAGELAWRPEEAALLGQRVENEWVGVSCGIMDQLVVACGREGHALLIDCRSLEIQPVPLPAGTAVVVLDTATRRGLVDSAYNERRAQCEAAAAFFGVPALRDVDPALLAERAAALDPVTLRRARHVVTENARTLEAAEAMRRGDVARLGELMNASHASLRDDFEVTNEALDTMVRVAQHHPACFGARMTGAGFGGCAVALVAQQRAQQFLDAVVGEYAAATRLAPSAYICSAAAGTRLERIGPSAA